ncbi:phage portal protein [Carnobacterium divergens]|uniref:phage portal protein n=1 Tax=Carnobacterium divergens TaxID=2748 RepID=UPI0039C915FF
MAIAIDREQVGDINNPSFDVINYCIKEHKKDIPRLQMLSDYYDGKPHKEGKEATKSPHEMDEIYINNAKYVVDLIVGFIVGSPISYTAAKGKNIDLILDAYDKMKVKKHDKELEKDLSTFGIGYELQYLSLEDPTTNETIPKIACIDPRGIFIVVDDTVERNTLFAGRHREKYRIDKSKYYEITIYTANHIITYYSKSLKLQESSILDTEVQEHFYRKVPVVEYRNNEEKQGDFEQQLSQIDKYNKLQLDRIKDKENFVKAIMILYGFGLPEEEPKKVNGQMVVEAPSKEDGSAAEFVTNTFQESEVQILAKAMMDDFHKTSYIPNLNDENFAGNVSGEAMKYKLFGLLLVLATKVGYMEDGLVQRMQLTENILNVKGQNIDSQGTRIRFKVNLPVNRNDVIQQIRDSQEFIPLLISLGWLDDIDDPKEVVEMLEEQQKKAIELQQKALGTAASHDGLEDEIEEEVNDDNSDIQKEK